MIKINGMPSVFEQKIISKTDNNQTTASPDELPEKIAGTTINGVIEDFKQGNTGNCYFLTRLKNLSRKSWGAKIIKESIEPDGTGGAYVTFKGALKVDKSGRTPMRFHVTVEDILSVREKQKSVPDASGYDLKNKDEIERYKSDYKDLRQFSSGDDDVLVLELAYNKYMRLHDRDMGDGDVTSYWSMKTYVTDEGDVVKLFTGSNEKGFSGNYFGTRNPALMEEALTEVKKCFDNYVLEMEFKENNEYGMLSNHAYEIIGFESDRNGNPMIVIINPHDTSKPIKMNYYDAIASASDLLLWENPEFETETFGFFGLNYRNLEDPLEKDLARIDSLQNLYHQRHEDCLKEEEEERRLADLEEKYSVVRNILNTENREERRNKLSQYLKETESETVNLVLKEKYAEIIDQICSTEHGIFRRKARKKLITPLADYIAEQAKTCGIDDVKVETFKTKCSKELKRFLFFREERIVNAFEEIIGIMKED